MQGGAGARVARALIDFAQGHDLGRREARVVIDAGGAGEGPRIEAALAGVIEQAILDAVLGVASGEDGLLNGGQFGGRDGAAGLEQGALIPNK